MANKIARKFRLGTEQKVVLNRLKVIYDNGGPSEIVLGPTAINATSIESEVAEVNSETQEELGSVEIEIDIDGEAPEITIETPDDEKES